MKVIRFQLTCCGYDGQILDRVKRNVDQAHNAPLILKGSLAVLENPQQVSGQSIGNGMFQEWMGSVKAVTIFDGAGQDGL